MFNQSSRKRGEKMAQGKKKTWVNGQKKKKSQIQ